MLEFRIIEYRINFRSRLIYRVTKPRCRLIVKDYIIHNFSNLQLFVGYVFSERQCFLPLTRSIAMAAATPLLPSKPLPSTLLPVTPPDPGHHIKFLQIQNSGSQTLLTFAPS